MSVTLSDKPRASEVPADYDGLWRSYGGFIKGLVIKLGIPHQEADDVTSAIFARLIACDIIAQFDPTHQATHQGVTRSVTFRAFLAHHVALRVRGQRDKLARLAHRESLLCDAPQDGGSSWLELFGGSAWWDDYSHLDAAEFTERMRTHLALTAPPAPGDRKDMLALFDELVSEVQTTGAVSQARVRERFQICPATCRKWMAELRDRLTQASSAPGPRSWDIGGLTLGGPGLLSAIAILEASSGIMVRGPLARAGHPLAQAPDIRWYHAFARAEIALYPEIAIPSRTHPNPAGHVKVAVLHRLRRYVDEARRPC